ncbi:MAG: FkbM family methyltransferase [Rhodospirillales bacterium]|nr:FkbM family methyltransferase [Rhodospirillales bacterium]
MMERAGGVRSRFQEILLGLYALIRRSGFLQTSLGRWLFERAYDSYKEIMEAGEVDALNRFVPSGSVVIDVGANTGFFTRRFAKWVGKAGRVIAIEPEAQNFDRLTRRLASSGLSDVVECIQAVAAELQGELVLAINPDHPGDHRIGAEGVPVRAVTLDGLMLERDWLEVSLVKIDVQGAEGRVLEGACDLLLRHKPALFIEFDERAFSSQGTSTQKMLGFLAGHGYVAHLMGKGGIVEKLTDGRIIDMMASGGYHDLLFLPVEAP